MTDTTPPSRPQPDREIATIGFGRDITRGYLGPLLIPQDRLLNLRGDNYRVWENLLSEPQVQSVLQQRRLGITRCEWRVDAASDARIDKKAAQFVEKQLQRIGWDRITGLMHYGIFYGFAAAEVIYGRDGSNVSIEKIKVRNRRRFRFDSDENLRLLTYQNMIPGELCEDPYFWHFCTGADNDDDPYGVGLAHWLYWPVIFKRNGLKFWLTFLEKFGSPTAVGKYPVNATPAEKAALLGAMMAIHTDAGMIIPDGMEATLLEAARSGSADYKAFEETMDDTIAKVVLGQTMTSESRGGQVKGDMQHDVRQDIVKADADLICESFNLTIGQWLTAWNFPSAQPPRVFRVVEEPEDLDKTATRDESIAKLGFKPTLKYIQDTYGDGWQEAPAADELRATPAGAALADGQVVPMPAVIAQTTTPGATPPPKSQAPNLQADAAAFAAADASLSIIARMTQQVRQWFRKPNGRIDFAQILPLNEQQDAVGRMVDQLDTRVQPTMTRWVGQLRGVVDNAKSLEELRDGVLSLQPNMSLDDYATVMAQAMAAAALAGRHDIMDEANRT